MSWTIYKFQRFNVLLCHPLSLKVWPYAMIVIRHHHPSAMDVLWRTGRA